MSIFFDLDSSERDAVTEHYWRESMFTQARFEEARESVTKARAAMSEAKEREQAALDRLPMIARNLVKFLTPSHQVVAAENDADLDQFQRLMTQATSPNDAHESREAIARRRKEIRESFARISLKKFPILPTQGALHPEKFVTHFSCKTPPLPDADLEVRRLILRDAATTLYAVQYSEAQLLVRMEQWFSEHHLDREVAFNQCPSGLLYLLFAFKWLGVEISLLELGGLKVFRFLGTLPQRDPTQSDFAIDYKIVVQNYLRLRLEPRFHQPTWLSADAVLDVYQLAQLVEASTFSKFPIDSVEFRESNLHKVPTETIHLLAQKAGIGIADARRLPLVDLVSAARDKQKETFDGLIASEYTLTRNKPIFLPQNEVSDKTSENASASPLLPINDVISIARDRFLIASKTSAAVRDENAAIQSHQSESQLSGIIDQPNADLCEIKTLQSPVSNDTRRPAQSRQDARDEWIYNAGLDVNRTWAAIRFDLNSNECPKNQWRTIGTDEGVRMAAQRYASRSKLAPLPERKTNESNRPNG